MPPFVSVYLSVYPSLFTLRLCSSISPRFSLVLSVFLSFCLFLSISVRPSFDVPGFLSCSLCASQSFYVCIFRLSTPPSCLYFKCQSVCSSLSVFISLIFQLVCLSFISRLNPSTRPFVCTLRISQPVCLSLFLYSAFLSTCVSVCLCPSAFGSSLTCQPVSLHLSLRLYSLYISVLSSLPLYFACTFTYLSVFHVCLSACPSSAPSVFRNGYKSITDTFISSLNNRLACGRVMPPFSY